MANLDFNNPDPSKFIMLTEAEIYNQSKEKLNFTKYDIITKYPTLDDVVKRIREIYPDTCHTKALALKWLGKHIPQESYYQRKILSYLKKLPIKKYVVKIAQGPYSEGGIPDIHFESNGIVYHFEVKRPYIGEESESQIIARNAITESGGHSYVVTFVDEVRKILIQEGVIDD